MYSRALDILHDKHSAEDALQQSFERIINNLHKINPDNCPRTRRFVVIICENVAKNIYNNRLYLNKKDSMVEELDEDMPGADTPLDIVVDKDSVAKIREAIKCLSPTHQDIIHLKLTYNCTLEELVDILGVPLATVKKRLYRARKELAAILQRRDGNE